MNEYKWMNENESIQMNEYKRMNMNEYTNELNEKYFTS